MVVKEFTRSTLALGPTPGPAFEESKPGPSQVLERTHQCRMQTLSLKFAIEGLLIGASPRCLLGRDREWELSVNGPEA